MSTYHSQNLTDGRLPKWRYGRAWWWKLTWGWNILYKTSLLSVSVHRWGFHIYLLWFGFYLTGRDEECGERGRWEVSWHDGRAH